MKRVFPLGILRDCCYGIWHSKEFGTLTTWRSGECLLGLCSWGGLNMKDTF